MKKLLSAGLLSLALLAGSAFAFSGQHRNHDWDEQSHHRHARVVYSDHDRGLHRGWYKHNRRVRIINGRRVVIVRTPIRRVHRVYYDRHVRMP